MKTKIGTKPVRVVIEKVAKGLYDAHQVHPDYSKPLKSGILNDTFVKYTENNIKAQINSAFDEIDQGLYKSRIDQFVLDVVKEVCKEVIKMAVLAV